MNSLKMHREEDVRIISAVSDTDALRLCVLYSAEYRLLYCQSLHASLLLQVTQHRPILTIFMNTESGKYVMFLIGITTM